MALREETTCHTLDPGQRSGLLQTEVYQYSPLSEEEKQIRVLVLLQGEWDDPIEGTIQHATSTSDQSVNYETVSYAWGDKENCGNIFIDGCGLLVPENTIAALRRLRLRDRPRRIWIDAVCIDQKNVDERSHQVAMMTHVYSRGFHNCIHLGEMPAQTARAAVKSLSAILAEIRAAEQRSGCLYDILYDKQGLPLYSDVNIEGDIDFDALETLFSVPWFSRLWVMQEATVSSTSTCFFSEESFLLVDTLRAAVWLNYKWKSIPHSLANSSGLQNGPHLWNHVDSEGYYHSRGGSSIANALSFAKQLTASVPHDSVYGALGLMRRVQDEEDIPHDLRPDYRRRLVDVCRDATWAALCEEDGEYAYSLLRVILHRSEYELEDLDWLSWVPRWNRPWDPQSDPVELSTSFSADGEARLPRQCLVRAGDPNRLSLIGISIDQVSERFTILEYDDLFEEGTTNDRIQGAITFARRSHDNRSESEIANVLIAGTNSQYQRSRETDLLAMRIAMKDEYRDVFGMVNNRDSEEYKEAWRFHVALRHACVNRALFNTSKGRLGLGPRLSRSGDRVVLLYGFRTPCILRQYGDGNNFRILGEAYLEGAMYGEDYRAHKASGKPDEEFIIF